MSDYGQIDPDLAAQLYGEPAGPEYPFVGDLPWPPPSWSDISVSPMDPVAGIATRTLPVPPAQDLAPGQSGSAPVQLPSEVAAPAAAPPNQAPPFAFPAILGMPPPPADQGTVTLADEPFPGSPGAGAVPFTLPFGDLSAPAPIPAPDTITGADISAQRPLAQLGATYGANPLAIPDEQARTDYLTQLRLQHPAQFAEIDALQREALARKQAGDALELANRNLQVQQQNLRIRQEADAKTREQMRALDAETTRLASTPIDTSGGISWITKIGGVLSAIAGGLYQGATGRPMTTGIDMLQTAISRGIEAQKAQLAARRSALGERRAGLAAELGQHQQDFVDSETMRIAALKYADQMLATQQLDFAAGTTRSLRLAAMRGDIAQSIVSGQQAVSEHLLDRNLKIGKFELEQQQLKEQIAARQQANYLRAQELKAQEEERKAKEGPTYTPDVLAAINPGLPPPKVSMTMPQYERWLSAQKTGQEAVAAERANTPAERDRELGVAGIVDSKGDVAHFRNPTEAAKVADSLANAEDVVRKTDDLIKLVEDHGYSPDFLKSPEWQKAQQTYASLLLTAKEKDHLGALSVSDIELEAKKIGTADPTQIRSTVAGMKQFRHDTVESTNVMLSRQAQLPKGRTLQRWEPPSTFVKTAEDLKREELLKPSTVTFPQAVQDAMRETRRALPLADADAYARPELIESIPAILNQGPAQIRAQLSPDQYKTLQEVAATYQADVAPAQRSAIARDADVLTAVDDPAARAKARDELESLARDAKTEAVRQLAQQALVAASLAEQQRGTPPIQPPIREVTHETVPPVPLPAPPAPPRRR